MSMFGYQILGFGGGKALVTGIGDFLLRLITGTTATGDGDTDPTVTRATTKVIQDHEGKLITIDSGEIAQNGARRVQNMMTASEDMTNGAYTDGAGATSSATSTVFDGTSNADVTQSITITDDGSGAEGRYFNFSVKISLDSGSISADNEVTIRVAGTAVTAGALELGTQLGATAKRFELIVATDAAGTTVIPEVECDSAVTLGITEWQVEEVTGQFSHTCGDYASVGVASDPWHGAGVDGVQYFSTHNGNTVASTGIVTEAAGADINSSNSQFADVIAEYATATDDCFYTDHDTANTITGDLDLKVRVALADWGAAHNKELFSKTLGTTSRTFHTYIDSSGQAVFFTKNNPTSYYTNSAVLGFVDRTRHWLRITRESSGGLVNFYTAPDSDTVPTSWTQSGTADQATYAGALIATNADLCVGNANVGWSTSAKGSFFRALLYKTIDSATPDVDFNPNDWNAGWNWTSSGTNSEIWMINGDTRVAGPKALWTDLDGTADGWTTPDSVATSITGDIFLACWAAVDDWQQATSQYVIGKWETTGSNKSYCFATTTTGTLRLLTSPDGSSSTLTDTTGDPGFINGTVNGFAVSLDVSANTVKFWTTTDSPWTNPDQVTWVQFEGDKTLVTTGIADKTGLLVIGGTEDDAAVGPVSGRIMRAYGIASTDSTVAPAWDFDPRNYQSGSTFTAATGEVWTIIGDSVIEGGNFPQMPWTANGPNGLNSEQAATNLCLQSRDTSTSWTEYALVIDQNAGIGAFGTNTMSRLNVTASDTNHYAAQWWGVVAGNTYCLSVDLKDDGARYAAMGFAPSGVNYSGVAFDLVDGIVLDHTNNGTVSLQDSGISPLPNGVFRCWGVFNTTQTTGALHSISVSDAATSFSTQGCVSYQGVAGEDILMENMQGVLGTLPPSSIIETTTTAVTRNKDQLSYAGADNVEYPLTGRVRYTPNQIEDIGVLLDVNDGTADDRVELSVTAAGKPRLLVRSGAADVADITADNALVLGVSTLINFVVDTDDARLYVDEVATGTDDTSLAVPAEDATSINVGEDYNNANQPNGFITDVGLANENQSTAEIISWNAE